MNAPEWTRDEHAISDAKIYLRQGSTVDFFEMIARNIIQTHPDNLPLYALSLVNDIIDGKEGSCDLELKPKKLEDNKYMRDMNVSEFLDAWVLALLCEKPTSDAERLSFHKKYLQSLIPDSASHSR
ncbi:unnamed protein product [Phytomonas sp. Hart1]|nr:unnamed protein product [Phytomonas sp. Hart1]|eukprot:CCW67992.1 unnamed protein product [Phytomonas sp. isolate Hart1]